MYKYIKAISTFCGVQIGFSKPDNLTVNTQEAVFIPPIANMKRVIKCDGDGTIRIVDAHFGRRSKVICPNPSAYAFYSGNTYCNQIKGYFQALKSKFV